MKKQEEYRGKEELKQEFILLKAKGLSYSKIAKKLKVSKATLTSWYKALGEEIASLRAMELEALYEGASLLKEGRIKLLSQQLKAIQKELKQRDLSTVSTDKLMDLLLKYFSQLKAEYVALPSGFDGQESHMKDGSGTKLNAQEIQRELERLLLRYRTGLLPLVQAQEEAAILRDLLKAQEQGDLESKIDHLNAVLCSRGGR